MPAQDPADTPMRVVWLGNHNAVERPHDPDDEADAAAEGRPARRLARPAPGKRCTRFHSGAPLLEAFNTLVRIWPEVSDDDAPAWVASNDPTIANLAAAHWGCELRDPDVDNPDVARAVEVGLCPAPGEVA